MVARIKMTDTEKLFRKKLKRIGWYAYRDEQSGRMVANCYPDEVQILAKRLKMPIDVVGDVLGVMVKASAVEPLVFTELKEGNP